MFSLQSALRAASPSARAVARQSDQCGVFRLYRSHALRTRLATALSSLGACQGVLRLSRGRTHRTKAATSLRASRVEAVQLVTIKNERLTIDERCLSGLMESLRAASCERIAVVSIAGALRQGKSFFLDLLARYLDSPKGWLSESLLDHQRFKWRAGMERATDGIWVCPQVFDGPGSEQTRTGLLLLDTQGTYEPGATRWQNNTLLGLAGFLSAILIFNVSKQLQEDTVEDVQVALQLLHMSCRQNGLPRPPPDSKCLMFLVRDWAHEKAGVNNLDDDFAQPQLPMNPQEQDILEGFVHSTTAGQGLGQFFETLECHTLPHPGHIDRPSWTGETADISDDFLTKCEKLFDALNCAATAQTNAAIPVQRFEQTLQDCIAILNSSKDLAESGKSPSEALSDFSLLSAVERAGSCYRAGLFRAGALPRRAEARLQEILAGEVAARRALVAEELAAAHCEALTEATAELRRAALFSTAAQLATKVSELEDVDAAKRSANPSKKAACGWYKG